MPDGSYKDRTGEIIDNYKKLGLDAVVGIGGDGSMLFYVACAGWRCADGGDSQNH